jgi:hypothetical protein
MQYYYGKDSGIQIDSIEGSYTKVVLYFPKEAVSPKPDELGDVNEDCSHSG